MLCSFYTQLKCSLIYSSQFFVVYVRVEEKPISCLIYGKYKGTCKYVCDMGEQKDYLAWECSGRICCYNSHCKY